MIDIRLISILGLLILISCKEDCRVVKQNYDNLKEKEVFIYPDCSDTTYYRRQGFYRNGQMSSEGYYRNGQKTGKFRSWAENGNQTADWEIVEGKEHGFIQCWYDNGVKKREATLEKGIENGHFKEWQENGKLICEGDFLSGKKTGSWKYWEEDGSWKIRNYINDTLNGNTLEHLVDSLETKLISGQYKNGKETGLWKWFDKDSILYLTAVYLEGKLAGEHTEYYSNGKIKSKGTLVDGSYEGEVIYYDEKGNITKTEYYRNGDIVDGNRK
jgi:antitoxin component YwqK of YwqJK toxin-antitoxin module